jgi:hypothetical protein
MSRPSRGSHNLKPIDTHYQTIQIEMHGVFQELVLAAFDGRQMHANAMQPVAID